MRRIGYAAGLLVVAVSMTSAPACSSSSEPGVRVVVGLEAATPAAATRDSKTLVTNLGYEVTLRRAYLSTATVEVFASEPVASRWGVPWIRSASAHSVGTPTLLGISAVESLLEVAPSVLILGELSPPPGRYGRVQQTIAPADADALGFPADGAMAGQSIYVEGDYARPGAPSAPFVFSSSGTFVAEMTFDAPTLDTGGRSQMKLFLGKAPDHWFDGIDFESTSDAGKARQLLGNVGKSLRARAE